MGALFNLFILLILALIPLANMGSEAQIAIPKLMEISENIGSDSLRKEAMETLNAIKSAVEANPTPESN